MNGVIMAVCVSDAKGVAKRSVGSGLLVEGFGLQGDAHGGDWHRQISLLSLEKIQEFNRRGGDVADGDFGENLVVTGIDLATLPVGTLLEAGAGGALLEVTQIGKECHRHCRIHHRVGDCIMPREGIFAKVLRGGEVCAGDAVAVRRRERIS